MVRKRPPMAVAQSNDFEVLEIWGPEDHEVVLAEFTISGLQGLLGVKNARSSFQPRESFPMADLSG